MSVHKGLDDLLAAGGKPQRLTGAAVDAFFASVRARLYAPQGEPPPVVAEVRTAAADVPRPPFPVDVFPVRIANFAHCVERSMGCSIDFPGLGILVVSGAAVGGARCLRIKSGWDESPSLYAAIVGDPGAVKTPALRAVMAPIHAEQARIYREHKAAQERFENDLEAFKRAQRDGDESGLAPDEPTEPLPMQHLFAGDTTVEALASNLEDSPKGILYFRDELTAWVRSLDMYRGRGNDRQFYLSAWSSEMVKVDRKSAHGRPIVLPHPFISVLGGIQPDMLHELVTLDGCEDGFIDRILFAYPNEAEIRGWIDDAITENDAREWQTVVCRLLNLQPEISDGESARPRVLQFNAEGRDAYRAWTNRLAAEMNADDFAAELVGPYTKLKAHCARFALIIHMLRAACGEVGTDEGEGDVDATDVAGAEKLCAYFKVNFRIVYPRLKRNLEDKRVEALIQWMQRRRLDRCTARDIQRAGVAGIKKASEAEDLMAAAVDRGLGLWLPNKDGPEAGKKFLRRATV